jgi:hypothetical protein
MGHTKQNFNDESKRWVITRVCVGNVIAQNDYNNQMITVAEYLNR